MGIEVFGLSLYELGFSRISQHIFNWMNSHLTLNLFNMYPLYPRFRWEMGHFLIRQVQVGLDYYSSPTPLFGHSAPLNYLSGTYSFWLERTFWALKWKAFFLMLFFLVNIFMKGDLPKSIFLTWCQLCNSCLLPVRFFDLFCSLKNIFEIVQTPDMYIVQCYPWYYIFLFENGTFFSPCFFFNKVYYQLIFLYVKSFHHRLFFLSFKTFKRYTHGRRNSLTL